MNKIITEKFIYNELKIKKLIVLTKHEVTDIGYECRFVSNLVWNDPMPELKALVTDLFTSICDYEVDKLKGEPCMFLTCFTPNPLLTKHIGSLHLKKFTRVTICKKPVNKEVKIQQDKSDDTLKKLAHKLHIIDRLDHYWNTIKIPWDMTVQEVMTTLLTKDNVRSGHSCLRNSYLLKSAKEIKTIDQHEKEQILIKLGTLGNKGRCTFHYIAPEQPKRPPPSIPRKRYSQSGSNKRTKFNPLIEYEIHLGYKIINTWWLNRQIPWLYIKKRQSRVIRKQPKQLRSQCVLVKQKASEQDYIRYRKILRDIKHKRFLSLQEISQCFSSAQKLVEFKSISVTRYLMDLHKTLDHK